MAMDGIKGTGGAAERGFYKAQSALRRLSLVKPESSSRVGETAPVGAGTSDLHEVSSENQVDITRSSVREEKVLEARKRIAEGYYDRADIKEAITRSLLENFGMGE